MIATASGARAAWAENSAGIDDEAGAGRLNTARLPHPSSPCSSAFSNRSIDESRRPGSVVIAISTRPSRFANSETSKFASGLPAPAVLRKSWSPPPENINAKAPT
ncbi:hypothetical protein A5655_12430 [Mycobacterium sp. 1081908.1]|nr:hypothetical protein A5655_12430 [Mycobacterium sp. 1081908.1]